MAEVRLTRAGWSALECYYFGGNGASKGGVTNCVNQGVLVRNAEGVVEVTALGQEVGAHVWGAR